MPHRGLHIVLALALILFAWAELEHSTEFAAHQDGGSCAVCLFASPLGNGIAPVAALSPQRPALHTPTHEPQAAVILPSTHRHTLGQRGPPRHS